jgi:benzodiazapine receptor
MSGKQLTQGAIAGIITGISILVVLVGIILGVFTGKSLKSAAQKLQSSPSPIVFQIIWPILYACIGIALGLLAVMPSKTSTPALQWTAFAFILGQLVLNYAWTPVYSRGEYNTANLMLVVMLMLTFAGIAISVKAQVVSAALLSPYAAWLIFALILSAQTRQASPR